jgi:3-hydroxyisobutyrate dehydrogenase-like beta-hydroxyacid dehydrogenase
VRDLPRWQPDFGEAGQAIAAGLREASGVGQMPAFDIFFPRREGEKLRHAANAAGVCCAASAADAVRGMDIIVSAVTAASSVEAAQSVQAHLADKPHFLDINSVSPGRKQQTSKLLGDAARAVDVAVVAPIHPARHQTPMLLAGPHAAAIAPTLAALAMRVDFAGAEIGAAAAIKMVRSVMIKGIEALTLECFLAAAGAGVVDDVAASMKNNYPGIDWAKVVP